MVDEWCCEKKCFKVPDDQLDGIACDMCGAFNFCMCGCMSHSGKKLNHTIIVGPPLKMFECYKFDSAFECEYNDEKGVCIFYKSGGELSQLFVREKVFQDKWLASYFDSLDDFNESLYLMIWLGGDDWELECL